MTTTHVSCTLQEFVNFCHTLDLTPLRAARQYWAGSENALLLCFNPSEQRMTIAAKERRSLLADVLAGM